ncbi:unnamed protein product [Musa acuminata subsp. malaccensis]|uniref:(wild Malaysian banana) hypothetical protein n=1 Tax=Musa acuminata subsp. malaccensis TaxID=214687 RepID=A0A804J4A9_MUSAM|nr:PREDICTED: zinc transporter 8-like [Musa acuminata subsp. malaccensis]CAG1838455.1 unnamed protein product [Musa acuminata subsp. malaccensis]
MRGAWRFLFLVLLRLLPLHVHGDGEGDCSTDDEGRDKKKALPLKIAAIVSILVCGGIGVGVPVLGMWIQSLRPEKDIFFVIKAFAAGVILATGFIHILPDAFETLTSSCLAASPWQDFLFAGFCAMVGAIWTLMVDTLATGYFSRLNGDRLLPTSLSEATNGDVEATHDHTHGAAVMQPEDSSAQLIRHRVVSQVLELGIVVHSVIIGISLGASEPPSTIRPLVAALSFHQFFEGMGLGGCIVQARFEFKAMVTMGLFFSLTTPVGIAIGTGISSVYNENSPTALIVQGLLDSVIRNSMTSPMPLHGRVTFVVFLITCITCTMFAA